MTVTTCVVDAELPCASVAEYVSVVVPTGNTLPVGTPLRDTAPTPGQLSVAEPVPNVAFRLATVTPQEVAPGPVKSVTAAGAVTTGMVLSITVTVCVAVDVLPPLSVAVHTTVVTPTGKVLPDGLLLTVTEQLSLADAVPSVASLTTVSHDVAPGPVYAVTSAGAVIVGLTPSMTVMVWTALAELPAPSVAVNVRVMILGLAADPAPLEVSVTVTTGTPQLSTGGPGGSGLPFSSSTTPRVAWFGFAAGTSLGQT